MEPMNYIRADSKTVHLLVKTAEGLPKDLTGWTSVFLIKENIDKLDDEYLHSFTGDIVDPATSGGIDYVIDKDVVISARGTYFYKAYITKGAVKLTVRRGDFRIV